MANWNVPKTNTSSAASSTSAGVMGGRQSSQNTPRQNTTHSSNVARHSLDGSLDQPSSSRRIGSLFGSSSSSGLSATPPDRVTRRRRRRDRNDLLIEAHSLPANLFPAFLSATIKCPVCNKRTGSEEIEAHLLSCLAKPRVSYNEDTLKLDAGECIICFDDMVAGETIARLPCLCIYHKKCLDDWFQRNRSCPEHPEQIPQEIYETDSINPNSTDDNPINPDAETEISNQTDGTEHDELLGAVASTRTERNLSMDGDENTENVFILPLGLEANESPNLRDRIQINSSLNNEMNDRVSPRPTEINRDFVANTASPDDNRHVDDETDIPLSPFESDNSFHSPTGKTVVHVDDGSLHGSQSLLDEDDLAQLASKIKTILVAESTRAGELENT